MQTRIVRLDRATGCALGTSTTALTILAAAATPIAQFYLTRPASVTPLRVCRTLVNIKASGFHSIPTRPTEEEHPCCTLFDRCSLFRPCPLLAPGLFRNIFFLSRRYAFFFLGSFGDTYTSSLPWYLSHTHRFWQSDPSCCCCTTISLRPLSLSVSSRSLLVLVAL